LVEVLAADLAVVSAAVWAVGSVADSVVAWVAELAVVLDLHLAVESVAVWAADLAVVSAAVLVVDSAVVWVADLVVLLAAE